MYLVTLLFNLPTTLKLVELSQPNQPLLQRLLREAPGTYQHSLQVANLAEQAANAIGANAELTRVAALYHDIGKMLNPAFFVENQADNVNPHDVLGDPYRSADMIISHVTDGDRLARQYRLPARIRDFIMEHHGTTLVAYFYRQAVGQADDEESVDVDQFMYPGPRPQSRETAVLMLADSCESTVRARKPTNKQEIADIVQQILDARMRDAQLDDSGLTTNDIKTIRYILIEMLQAVFHPRINYPTMPTTRQERQPELATEVATADLLDEGAPRLPEPARRAEPAPSEAPPRVPMVPAETGAPTIEDNDDSPLPEVPPLRRTTTNLPRVESNGDGTPETAPAEDRVDTE
jgi:putative nucleotidyltransferase with HDIG domain